jgi:competence protein ComEC
MAEYVPLPALAYSLMGLMPLTAAAALFKTSRRYRWFFGLLLGCTLFVVGHTLTAWHDERSATDFFVQYVNPEHQGGYTEYIGTVDDMPKPGDKSLRARLRLEAMKVGGDWRPVSGNVMAFFKKDSTVFDLAYGERLAFQARMNPLQSSANKGAFDYSRYLHFQNIHHQTYLSKDEWAKLGEARGNPVLRVSHAAREMAVETLRKHLKTDNEFAVGAALVVGYKDEITEDVRLAYASTGAMHVLAVSGLHVGIIYMIISFLFDKIKSRWKWWLGLRLLGSLVVIWGFALVTGASPSVLRAATMFSFVIVGDAFAREKNIYNTLAAAAFFTLAVNPYLLFSPGFQLSYLAVLGIVFFQPVIEKSWYVENRVGAGIWSLISVSLGAQLTTLPVSLYYFHQFPTYFWLSGLVVVPAAPLVLGGGLLLFLAEAMWAPLAVVLGWLLNALIWLVNAAIFIIQKFPYHLIEGIHITVVEMLMGYAIIALLAAWLVRDDKRLLFAALGMGALMALSASWRAVGQQQHREVAIYHVRGGYLMDYFHDGARLSVRSENLSKKSESFAADGYRKSLGAREEGGREGCCFQQGDFIQLGDLRFFFLRDNYYNRRSLAGISVDVLVLQENPFVNFDKLSDEFDVGWIVADGSNSPSRVRFWRNDCEERQGRIV